MKIGILLSQQGDPCCQEIYQWIISFGHTPVAIYEKEILENEALFLHISTTSFEFQITDLHGNTFDFTEIDFFFQRTWSSERIKTTNNVIISEEDSFKSIEITAIRDFILRWLKQQKKLIGYSSHLSKNKLSQLLVARNSGFKIPQTIITKKKKDLLSIFKKKQIVTKSIQTEYISKESDGYRTNYSTIVDINDLPEEFFSALFQSKIEKILELRIFYFLGEFYSVAMKPNSNEKEVDIRKLLASDRTINYPYQLPKKIEDCITLLMKTLELDMGSLDVILDVDQNYVFLEVNPHGQISMVSQGYGYPQVAENIATALTNKNGHFQNEKINSNHRTKHVRTLQKNKSL
ncbi:hypothetical protein ACFSTE_12790 [Aquimarina hainanensis]|uniref:ATP-grasp domain-containing protein n=1 Tax=Aquimarina hainanensis TaxID=1578017 RepID=A0ABW5NAW8_9FLAO